MEPPETARRRLPVLPVLLATVVVAGLEIGVAEWSGGFGSRAGPDLYTVFLPRFHHVADAYRAGRFPLWNPFESCGLPFHASAFGETLYAPTVVANLLLPMLPALRALWAAHSAALVLLTLLYLRRAAIDLRAGAVAAILVTTSQFNGAAGAGIDQPHFFFSVTWIPAILVAWERVLEARRGALALLALCLAAQWLPGYPEFSLATALVFAMLAVLDRRSTVVRRLALAGVAVALGALVAAAQILPIAEMVAESARKPGSEAYRWSRFFFAVHGAHELVDRSIRRYGAAAVFSLLVGLLLGGPRRAGWAAALVVTTFIMNPPLGYLFEVWPFSGLRSGYGWNAIAPFFAGCLAASGVDGLRRMTDADRAAWLAPAVGSGVAVLAFATGHPLEGAAAGACAVASSPALRRRGGWALPVGLVALHGLGVMSSVGTTLNKAPDPAALAARVTLLRHLSKMLDARIVAGPELRAGLVLPEELRSAVGYQPSTPPRRTFRLERHLRLPFLVVGTESLRGTFPRLAANPGVASALGIGLVAVPPSESAPLEAGGYKRIAKLPDGHVVLHRPAAPRFQVVRRVLRAADEEDAFRLVTAPGFDPAVAVVLEEDPPFPLTPTPVGARSEPVLVSVDEPERIELRVDAHHPGVLVVADTFFPGWRARVDGAPATILRANYAFRAVALAQGRHVIELVYAPDSFRLGVVLSVVGLAVTVALAAIGRGRAPA